MLDHLLQEYPKMLYRPGDKNSPEKWGYPIDTLIVRSITEEENALSQHWCMDINQAIRRYKRQQITQRLERSLQQHRRYWLVLAALIAGLVVALMIQ